MKERKNFMGLILVAVCVALLFFGPTPVFAEKILKVGAYGGYFKDSFDKHIFPDFTKETGIKVESVAEPTGEAWLVQLEQAARAGVAPADVSMIAQVAMLRGQRTKLWMPLAGPQIDSEFQVSAAAACSQVSGWPGRWDRSGLVVYHPGIQHQSIQNGTDGQAGCQRSDGCGIFSRFK